MIYVLISVVLSVFGGMNYYIGLRVWQWLSAVAAPATLSRPAYWIAFWLLALSFPLARFAAGWLPLFLADLITKVSAYWLGIFVYVLPMLLLIDLFRLVNRFGGLVTAPDVNLVRLTGGVVCLLLVSLMVYGTWRARTPVVTEYALTIPKSAGAHKELHVVLVSDTHLGAIIGNGRIRELVSMVNGLKPDLILVAGDIIDDDFRPFLAHDMPAELSQMKARLGTYGVLGNHDAGSAQLEAFRGHLQRAGIHLLVDEWVKVDESFYVVGRNDRSQRYLSGGREVPLSRVMAGVDTKLPILLMDHQPSRLDEAEAAGVDLLVAGHTHRGQLFPGNLITSRIFEVDWGYLQKQATHVVVSLGYGTWGPPVRIGNKPEVVSIRVKFGE